MSWGLPTYVESYSSLTETSTRAPARISVLRMVMMMMMMLFVDDDDDVVC